MARTSVQFKGVVPKGLNEKAMRLELLNALGRVGTMIRTGFKMTTASWEHQPVFTLGKESLKGGPSVEVSTDDDIYTLVNEGSPPHFISPNGDYPLFFHSEYGTKTAPGVIDSWEGGPGERDTFRPDVDHPGFPGRHFDQAIGQAAEAFFMNEMEEAMRKAAKASGWAL